MLTFAVIDHRREAGERRRAEEGLRTEAIAELEGKGIKPYNAHPRR